VHASLTETAGPTLGGLLIAQRNVPLGAPSWVAVLVNACADAIDDLFGFPGAIVGWDEEGSPKLSVIWVDGPVPASVVRRLGLRDDGTGQLAWDVDGRMVPARLLRAVSAGLWLAWIDLAGSDALSEDIDHVTEQVPGDAVPDDLQEAWVAQTRRVPLPQHRTDGPTPELPMPDYVHLHRAAVHDRRT
jgi:hypothetical protein